MLDLLKNLELDDSIKTQLQDGLQTYVEEQVAALKIKNDELLQEKRTLKEKTQSEIDEARRLAEEQAKQNGDFKQLFESQQQKAQTLEQQLEEMKTNIVKQNINTEAAKLAARLTKDTNKAQLLQQQLSQRLSYVDNEIRVTDENGQLTVSSVDDLANSIKTAYPFLVDGTQASGGGATKSQSSGDAVAKEISRADFDTMDNGKRAEFIKSGGKLFDE